MLRSLVGSEMCIRDRVSTQSTGERVTNMATISTALTSMLGVEHPVMLAGMGGIANTQLVGAVAQAGGFATFGAAVSVANDGPEDLRVQLREMAKLCGGRPYGVDLLVHGSEGGVMPALIKVFAEEGARAFIAGRGYPRKAVIGQFHQVGMVVGAIAGKVSHAIGAVAEGVDFVIVQGSEGGGHTGAIALSVLLPMVVDAVGGQVPVVAAGGIFDGRGLAAALSMGASGVWVGTRFMLTPEAHTHHQYKRHLLSASEGETVVTRAFTGKPLRALQNKYTIAYDQADLISRALKLGMLPPTKGLPAVRGGNVASSTRDGVWELHSAAGKDVDVSKIDLEQQAFVTGQCVGAIDQLVPAGQIISDMVRDAVQILSGQVKNFRLVRPKL
eukprot:TRINITY_DN12826_c0_g1_i1.p1 TRINITY_DN12826_c0_g1~~TRINITY_DN12826_c0_g1_i1.p1  ORF type:complete len:386 (-),score=106.34 TRINITY_DN12826_c0_g1_i1:349-1506(-)